MGQVYFLGKCLSVNVSILVTVRNNNMADRDYLVVKNSKAKSEIWKHFGLKKRKSDGEIETNIAVCYLCDGTVKYSGGTSNLNAHMRVYHPSQASSTQAVSSQAATGTSARYPPKSPRAIAITNSISNFIIKDLRPYRIVDSPEFRTMLKTLDPRVQAGSNFRISIFRRNMLK